MPAINVPFNQQFSFMLSESEQITDTVRLTAFVKKNFRTLMVYLITGCAIGGSIAFFIKKEYRSVANVYPPTMPSIEYSVDNPNFGYDVEADRLMQILMSNEIRDSVDKLFDLKKYYELDATDKEYLDVMNKKFKRDFTFERTPAMSVLIKGQTTDPELSANIVNYIVHVTNRIRERLYKQNIQIANDNAAEDHAAIKSKTDSMEKGLLHLLDKYQLNSLLLLASNAQIAIDLDKTSGNKAQGIEVASALLAFKTMKERLNESELRLVKTSKALKNPIPELYVIDKAEPRYKKIFPSYSLFALTGGIFSLCVASVVLLLKQHIE